MYCCYADCTIALGRHTSSLRIVAINYSVFSFLARTSCVRHNVSLFAQERFEGVFVWFWYGKFVIIVLLKLLAKLGKREQNAYVNEYGFSNKSKQNCD